MTSAIRLGFAPGEVLLVTGAASGIGRAVATSAVAMGLRVSAWDLDSTGLDSLAAEVVAASGDGGDGAPLITFAGDVADAEAVAEGFELTRQAFGEVTYLANNAGPPSAIPLEFDEAVRISVGSVRFMTDTWAAGGLPSGAAMVVTSSVAGNLVGTDSNWYSASKAALMGYVRHLAAHRAHEFRSNGVGPGMTDTPRLAGFAQSAKGREVLARIPVGRIGTPQDMANAILFLLSPLASYVNGTFLPVDGGWTITQ